MTKANREDTMEHCGGILCPQAWVVLMGKDGFYPPILLDLL